VESLRNQSVIRSLAFAGVRAFLIWEQRVASSNPAAPTNPIKALQASVCKALRIWARGRRHRPVIPHAYIAVA
jgi:hypothetical protein